mgnify:FL=1
MNKNDIVLIEAYIDGKLKGEALSSFESRLKMDEAFANEYNQRLKITKLWVDADDYSATRSQIAKTLHTQKSNFFRKNQSYILSIAASIIILFGVYMLLFQSNNNLDTTGNQFADVSDSISEENTIVFQHDEPYKLATIDSVKMDIELISPINGVTLNKLEPITFSWSSNITTFDTLFVCSELDNTVLLKLRVNLDDTTYTVNYPQLTKGKYYWYISDTTQLEKFNITVNK